MTISCLLISLSGLMPATKRRSRFFLENYISAHFRISLNFSRIFFSFGLMIAWQ